MQPRLVGVLNVTPDSFSDGGQMDAEPVLAKAQELIEAGAQVLDVGAESTRPGAIPLSADEEWTRLAPLWQALRTLTAARQVALSLDSRHAETVEQARAIGLDWINDVNGFQTPEMMAQACAHSGNVVVMHSLSIPADPAHTVPESEDVVAVMREWCDATLARFRAQGIDPSRILLDPGIGFGKTARQSWELLTRVADWCPAGSRVLVGHSRKSFLTLFSDAPAQQCDALTRLVSAMLSRQGVYALRVHDVAGHARLFEALAA